MESDDLYSCFVAAAATTYKFPILSVQFVCTVYHFSLVRWINTFVLIVNEFEFRLFARALVRLLDDTLCYLNELALHQYARCHTESYEWFTDNLSAMPNMRIDLSRSVWIDDEVTFGIEQRLVFCLFRTGELSTNSETHIHSDILKHLKHNRSNGKNDLFISIVVVVVAVTMWHTQTNIGAIVLLFLH